MAFKDQWTPEEDDLLRRCAEQGQSAAAASILLGDLFGVNRSRMAVLGRANRKGIAFRGQDEALARQKSEAAERRKARAAEPPKPDARAVAAELQRRRAEIRAEAGRNHAAQAMAGFAETAETAAEPAGDNPGVLFLERGFEATTVDDIAAALGSGRALGEAGLRAAGDLPARRFRR